MSDQPSFKLMENVIRLFQNFPILQDRELPSPAYSHPNDINAAVRAVSYIRKDDRGSTARLLAAYAGPLLST